MSQSGRSVVLASVRYERGLGGRLRGDSFLKRTETRGVTMSWIVYLSGEIHTDWRQQIIAGSQAAGLAITFTSAVTDHQASDAAGDVLGEQVQPFWRRDQVQKNQYDR